MSEKYVSYKMSLDEIRSNLYDYYNNVMRGFVSSGIYAIKRQQTVKKLTKTYVIITLCFSPWIYKGIVSGVNKDEILIFIFSFICILFPIIFLIYFFAYLIVDKDFSNVIKSDCLNNLLKTLLKLNVESEKETITDEEINKSGLFEKWNDRTTEDAFIVVSDKAKYRISETSMVYKTGSGKNTYTKPIFDGLLIKLENSKNLESSIEITTKTKESIIEDTQDYTKINFIWYSIGILIVFTVLYFFLRDILNFIPFVDNFMEEIFLYLWNSYKIPTISVFTVIILILSKIYRDWDVKRLQKQQQLRNSKKIKIGNSGIDEIFDIISSDDNLNVYDFVNQDLTELILNIKTLFNSSKVQLKFYDNSIMLAIFTNKDLFELGDLRYNPLHTKVSESFISQIAGILMFMDYVENKIK